MEKLIYKNPIIHQDFSDPDCIRVKDDYFMVASSFNMVPGLPVLHSKNLVEWEIINYIYDKLPWEKFNKVRHGEGAWAPSIRYHNGTYYCTIPFPDEGIYVSETKDPFGKWSDLHPLIEGRGIEDPCPIWTDDGKCYLVVGFIKSRIGFNSVLGVYEVSPDLKQVIKDYQIVYDGHDMNPTIEGPKFHYKNGYFYIMAPAGSVKGGWQTCLRSKNIYGPYESKIVLLQNDSLTNGPHQGALIDLDDEQKNWAFIHFQDKRAYGRITHLEPVQWVNDWPICGKSDGLLGGTPVDEGEYPVNIKTSYSIPTTNDFTKGFEPIWQTPANKTRHIYDLENGLKLYCLKELNPLELNLNCEVLTTKVAFLEFDTELKANLDNLNVGDSFGFTVTGQCYSYIDVKKTQDGLFATLYVGKFGQKDLNVKTVKLDSSNVIIKGEFRNSNIYDLHYDLFINGIKLTDEKLKAYAGRWISSNLGIYAKSESDSDGYAKVFYFNQTSK